VGVKHTAPQNVVLVCHKVGCICSDLYQNKNQRDSLLERDSESDDEEEG